MSVTRIQFGADGEPTERTLEAAMAETINTDRNELNSIQWRDVNAENEQNRRAALSMNGTPGQVAIERQSLEAKIYYDKQVAPYLSAPANESDVARRSREATLARNTAILNAKIENVEASAELAQMMGQLEGVPRDGITEIGLAGLRAEAAKLGIK